MNGRFVWYPCSYHICIYINTFRPMDPIGLEAYNWTIRPFRRMEAFGPRRCFYWTWSHHGFNDSLVGSLKRDVEIFVYLQKIYTYLVSKSIMCIFLYLPWISNFQIGCNFDQPQGGSWNAGTSCIFLERTVCQLQTAPWILENMCIYRNHVDI